MADDSGGERRRRYLRRRQPNPSYYHPTGRAWSPSPMATSRDPDREIEREIEEIIGVLREHGPLRRSQLRDALHARHWGPGRFTRALLTASRRGRVRRVRRGVFEAAD